MRPKRKEIVWTPDLAYAVGLIVTDGNLSKDGRHFDFTSNDRDLIETFKKCLGIANKVVKKKSSYTNRFSSFRIQFSDVALYRWLANIGLMPNKSKIIGKLDIPDDYFFHFLRGHLDGDGTVRKYQDRTYPNSLRLITNFNSASLLHLQWLQATIKRLLGFAGYLRKTNGEYRLAFSKYDSIRLLDEMYPAASVPCLFRKLVVIGEFVGITPR